MYIKNKSIILLEKILLSLSYDMTTGSCAGKNIENVEYYLNWKSLNYRSGTVTVDETNVLISATIVSLSCSFWVQLGKLSMPCAAPKRAPIKDPLATFSPPKIL